MKTAHTNLVKISIEDAEYFDQMLSEQFVKVPNPYAKQLIREQINRIRAAIAKAKRE